ncbi:MAG: 7-carboxy-7-deazaguanine synthase QueE [Pseudomonadota bacterium]
MSSPAAPQAVSLRISEIFFSVQGESSRVGLPTVFVRLTGCPLRCTWCDTEYAFTGGKMMSLDEILCEVTKHRTPYVCVTGGEPLAQKACLDLLTALCEAGFSVSLETSGAMDVSGVDARVSKIMDLKAPGSGEVQKNRLANLAHITAQDEIKIVLKDETDYQWARQMLTEHGLTSRCPVLFSPVQGALSPADLAEWILRDHLPVRMQVQLHKVIWGNVPGR